LVKLRPSYNGITLASQARDAGSTPVGRLKKEKICRKRTMNVNVPMGALDMGIVRLVRSTIGKTVLVLIAGKQGMKTARNN
jgi:hypothetical protein